MKKTYKAVEGHHLDDRQAQRYGEFIANLADEYGGVKPEFLVDLRGSPAISDWFEHDTEKAAYEYWKVQAYELLRSINVMIELPDGTMDEVRAFHPISVTVMSKPSEPIQATVKLYKKVEDILEDEDMRNQMYQQALNEFRYMRKKYRHIKELTTVFEAIDNI